MFYLFKDKKHGLYAIGCKRLLAAPEEAQVAALLLAKRQATRTIAGPYVGFHSEMVSPWGTNVRDILHQAGLQCVQRVEYFVPYQGASYDSMLQRVYPSLHEDIFHVPTAVSTRAVPDIAAYATAERLFLQAEEQLHLQRLAQRLNRPLTEVEVYGYAQVHAEHARHKVFNSRFVIDGVEKDASLFAMVKETTKRNPHRVLSAYTDNVAFLQGARTQQFFLRRGDAPSNYGTRQADIVCTLKAETHNFPATVEPVYGAGTGVGGELRDRMAGGSGSIPLGGLAVYMTAYARLSPHKPWEHQYPERPWRYQSPAALLIGASNGASDYNNKFGQPLVGGSVLTFEHRVGDRLFAYDKMIVLAGGVGVGDKRYLHKKKLAAGQKIVLLGGDNYRIGMGGSAVSSASTGSQEASIEQHAVQRANPEMQRRVANVIRFFVECNKNPIVSIHDHGAGGHLNCFLEMVVSQGGVIYTDALPIGDASLSEKELILNESQERMGLIIEAPDWACLQALCAREQAPVYCVGEVRQDGQLVFVNRHTKRQPVQLPVKDFLAAPPLPPVVDVMPQLCFEPLSLSNTDILSSIENVLRVDSVACKDWLTNKVDRCVGGRVAKQPCCGPLQLPLNNVGVLALSHVGTKGVATALGHAPLAGLIDPVAGAVLSLVEALTNLVWAPLVDGIQGVSCSANWMWPHQAGDRATLYQAVEGLTQYASALGINIPTGKDSLFMDQTYPSPIGKVSAPGTVVILATGVVTDIRRVIEPVLQPQEHTALFYLPLGQKFCMGGSAYAQTVCRVGEEAPRPLSPAALARAFNAVQTLVAAGRILSGHDISAGGLITTLLEMCFSLPSAGMQIDLSAVKAPSLLALLCSECPGWVIQADEDVSETLSACDVVHFRIGSPLTTPTLSLAYQKEHYHLHIPHYRKVWYESSFYFEKEQCPVALAKEKAAHVGDMPLHYRFPATYTQAISNARTRRVVAGVLREKGSNGEREMAYAFYRAGFEVRDIHMSDLVTGRETLQSVDMLAFVGGFSYADALGAAKGWSFSFLHNPKAYRALQAFYRRENTLSLGVCNGCQLMLRLALIDPHATVHPTILPNRSEKFECHFTDVHITENNTAMLGTLSGCRLGVWSAHAEGNFRFPAPTASQIVMRYSASVYPKNPNGSQLDAAGIASKDGRHLAMMPHIERTLLPWHWAYYPRERQGDALSPWAEAFLGAKQWLLKNA